MRAILKAAANGLATALVLPSYVLYRAARLISGSGRAFPGWSQAYGLVPGLTGVYLRRAFYRLTLSRCAADAWVEFLTTISHPTARVGRGVYVGKLCCLGDVDLGDGVLLGSQVSILNGGAQHGIERLDVPIREQPGRWVRVSIGEGTWIGERAVVMADVGRHCVVGAGAVVTRPIPDYAVAAGIPARVLRYRDDGALAARAPGATADFTG